MLSFLLSMSLTKTSSYVMKYLEQAFCSLLLANYWKFLFGGKFSCRNYNFIDVLITLLATFLNTMWFTTSSLDANESSRYNSEPYMKRRSCFVSLQLMSNRSIIDGINWPITQRNTLHILTPRTEQKQWNETKTRAHNMCEQNQAWQVV